MMDAEQINKRIHEFVTGTNCDHNEVSRKADGSEPWQCQQCGRVFLDGENWFPKPYTTDLNAVRKAELKCIEEFGRDAYLNALTDQVVVLGDFNERDTDDLAIATASALTRAQAVCDVLEVGKC